MAYKGPTYRPGCRCWYVCVYVQVEGTIMWPLLLLLLLSPPSPSSLARASAFVAIFHSPLSDTNHRRESTGSPLAYSSRAITRATSTRERELPALSGLCDSRPKLEFFRVAATIIPLVLLAAPTNLLANSIAVISPLLVSEGPLKTRGALRSISLT